MTLILNPRLVFLSAIMALTACAPTVPDGPARTPEYQSCVAGSMEGCVAHATQLESKGSTGRRAALIGFQYACHHKSPDGCAGLARVLGKSSGDMRKALKALKASCDGGVYSSCVELAGEVPRNQAVPLYRIACEGGDGLGCARLADQLRDKWRLQDQLREAYTYSEKACELGEPEGCAAVGQSLLFGSGVKPDQERGLELLAGTCTPEVGVGCERLARIYEQGVGIQPDMAKADQYYELASEHTPPVIESPQDAYLVYVDGCNNSDVLGCFNAAYALAEGIDVERNITTSRELFEDACHSGLDSACERWSEIRPAAEIVGGRQ